ncbi:MAG: DUF2272 domain-containing protein [Gammaproteobacteria bacterium]
MTERFLISLFYVFARQATILPVLLLIGCSFAPADRPFKMKPEADINPVFSIPTIRERMIFLARQEWMLFGRPEFDYSSHPPTLIYPQETAIGRETEPSLLSRVILYWYRVTSLPMVGYQGELRPWSSAFIGWLARSAGVPEYDLPSTVLHWDYIEHALNAGTKARFVAHDARWYAPNPGDLLCAPRGEGFIEIVKSFKHLRRGSFHCDLVVAKRSDQLDLIGGNVLDAVSLTHVNLDVRGCALPTPHRPWLIVLEQRDIE